MIWDGDYDFEDHVDIPDITTNLQDTRYIVNLPVLNSRAYW